MTSDIKKYRSLLEALLVSSAVSVLLFLVRVFGAENWRYWFLIWNLVLAWLPLIFAFWLKKRIAKTSWLSGWNILLTLLWLGFLPNSFYIITDLIHLRTTGEIGLLFDVVMFCSFIFNGLVLGYISLYIVHKQLLKRLSASFAHNLVALVLLACSFAIYLGRYLRWNTWDVLINPAGLLFDVSDRLVNPIAYPQAFVTTATFFLLLGSIYYVVWELARILTSRRKP